jgi:O-antigen biosynthesis protein WbqV
MAARPETKNSFLNRVWILKALFHVATLFIAFMLAYELRRGLGLTWWLHDPDAVRVVQWSVLYALIGAVVEAFFQTERTAWRYVSAHEVVALTRNVAVTVGAFLLCIFIADRGFDLPRSVLAIAGLLSLLMLVGVRLTWRIWHDQGLVHNLLPSWWGRPTSTDRTPLLIIGAMADADAQLRNLHADAASPYEPIGVITPNPKEVGLRVQGVQFLDSLEQWDPVKYGLIGRNPSKHALLFLEDPVRRFDLGAERIGELRKAGHVLLRPQTLTELGGDASSLQEIPLEEFLPRMPITLDATPVRALVSGKRVMVTGAGGSIGSEIARQLTSLGCAHLTLVDHSEFLLFEIDRELQSGSECRSRRAVLANVRDQARMLEVFKAEQPDIVFHAAALKHVELVEKNPSEGVLTNVLGTWNVVRAAIDTGVSQLVLISTDKAVAPTNVMGATKRIAESILELAPESGTRLSAVRFGNVLGSAGSVVPIFRDQIARGGPVLVTHPDVDRYFMTIPEAVQLVLHSTAINAARDTARPSKFLLEMGEPVKIVDLARQMIVLSGHTPDVDIMIEFSGLKPGEKLSEALLTDDEKGLPCAEGILEVQACGAGGRLTEKDIRRLVEKAHKLDEDAVRAATLKLAQATESA